MLTGGVRAVVVVVLLLMLVVAIAVIERRDRTEFLQADADRILDDPRLAPKTLARGREVFLAHCAGCHGADCRGSTATGTPDLTDEDFLYGTGRASEIESIVLHGIRSGDDKGWDLAWMPAFGQPVPYARGKLPTLPPGEIEQLTSYLRAINGASGEDPTAVSAGGLLFEGHGGCWDCHGRDAQGDAGIGAPNLRDGKWLRGDGSRRDISRVIREGLHGVSPAFRGRLDPADARAVAVYVASLHAQKENE
ncbi:MAG: c-type cytochrome [Gammaproteobacteria bacterium]|nr:c-type cytochrome [Gammaproteobacteria bacterium]